MEGDDNLIDSDDYYAWLGLSKDVSCIITVNDRTVNAVLNRRVINLNSE